MFLQRDAAGGDVLRLGPTSNPHPTKTVASDFRVRLNPAMMLRLANRQRRFVVMSGHASLLLAFAPLSVAAAIPMVSLARQTSYLLTDAAGSFEQSSESRLLETFVFTYYRSTKPVT